MALPYPKSNLDAAQVLQYAMDDATQTLRTTAAFSGTISVDLDPTTDGVFIGDNVSGNKLTVNADGSINANVAVVHTSDSVRLGNGTDFLTSTTVGPAKTLDVTVKEAALPLGAASEATLSTISGLISTLNSIETAANALLTSIDTKVLTDTQLRTSPIGVTASSLPLPTGAATAANQTTANASLASIDSKLTSPLTVTGSLTLADEPIKMSGTENGQPNGTEFTFVNTLRNQILAAKDRQQSITYADFGTKDQRVTQIDYTSPSIGSGAGFTARKTISYTLLSGKYRRDSLNWSLI
jgi:hypothetical protein